MSTSSIRSKERREQAECVVKVLGILIYIEMKSVKLIIGTLLIGILVFCVCDDLARGWNEKIEWKSFDEGIKQASEQGKLAMVVIHKSWCGACKRLKPDFAGSQQIEELSSKFVMINVMDDEEPSDPKFAPDGGYIPRIVFVNPQGEVRNDVTNPLRPDKYKYFFSTADEVVVAMKQALSGVVHRGSDAPKPEL